MVVTRSSVKKPPRPESNAESFIADLQRDYPDLTLRPGKREHWSPRTKTITYNPDQTITGLRSGVLHELAHAIAGHASYESDLELIKLESEAWVLAAQIGKKYGVKFSHDHIQNCLDTYRDWLHRRSTCPTCRAHGLQQSPSTYRCLNCQAKWSVTSDHFARAYRRAQSL